MLPVAVVLVGRKKPWEHDYDALASADHVHKGWSFLSALDKGIHEEVEVLVF